MIMQRNERFIPVENIDVSKPEEPGVFRPVVPDNFLFIQRRVPFSTCGVRMTTKQ